MSEITPEIMVRELGQVKALQTVTVHLFRIIADSLGQELPADTKTNIEDLLQWFEIEYENRLRAELGMTLRPIPPDLFPPADWPQILFDRE